MAESSLTYQNNHIKLMRFHIALAFVYFLLCSFSVWLTFTDKDTTIWLPALCAIAICAAAIFAHLLLAYGSKNRVELSRKASEFVGVLLMLGFPVGTLIGYFFLQCTIWRDPEQNH